MAFPPEHEIHRRRLSRNVGLGLVLGAFVVLMFALTIVKVGQGDTGHAGDAKKNTGVFVDPAAPKSGTTAP